LGGIEGPERISTSKFEGFGASPFLHSYTKKREKKGERQSNWGKKKKKIGQDPGAFHCGTVRGVKKKGGIFWRQ